MPRLRRLSFGSGVDGGAWLAKGATDDLALEKREMEKKNWLKRLDALDSGSAEDFHNCVTAIDEHALFIIRELGVSEMGVGCDAQEALSQMAMLLECAKMLRDRGLDLAEELRDRAPGGLPDHLIDPRSTDAMDLVMGTLKRCGFNKATQRAVVLAIASELDGGDPEASEDPIHIPDLQAKTAAPFSRFEARKDPKRSLIGPGEIVIEETFLQTALEAVEAVLEMAPHASQQGDGGPSIEDEATRAFSALRAARRCGTRAIELVDIDTTDNAEAAQ